MERIKSTGTVPARPAPDAVGTPGYFSEGNPGGGTPAAIVTDDWANAVQEELVQPILAAGLALDELDDTQLLQAIQFFSDQAAGRASSGLLHGRLAYGGSSLVRLDRAYNGKILAEIGGAVIEKNDASLNFDITTDLFEGVETVSTWYYVYLENAAGVLTPRLSATPPLPLTLYHPSQPYRCIGAFYNSSNGDIKRFHSPGDSVGGVIIGQQFEDVSDATFVLQPGTASQASYIALDLAGRIPAIAREIILNTYVAADLSTWHYGPESLIGQTTPSSLLIRANVGGATWASQNAVFPVPIENPAAPRIAWWRNAGVSPISHEIYVVGWR